jgi:hypothetical protein
MLPQGLKDSSLTTISPLHPRVIRFNLNKGVCPINSEMKLAIFAIPLLQKIRNLNIEAPAFAGAASRRQAKQFLNPNDQISKTYFIFIFKS